MALLTLDGITRRIRGVAALDGVGLVVEAGTVHALLGPDQTAKAALLDILSGAEGADAGRMVLDGEPLEIASTRHARQLGFALVRHGAPLFAPLSVAENVGLAAGLPTRLGGWVRREALRQAARRLLAHAGGGHVPLERRVDGLAPADRLFVALAMALARRPRLLLLDAPGEALDAEAAARLRGALRRMADAGTAVLWATGPPDGAADIADAVTVLADAQVAASGPPAAVPAETAAEDPSEGPPRLRAAGRAPRAERHLRRLRAVAAAVVAAVLLGVLGWRVWGFLGPHNVAKLAFDVAVLALAGTGLTLVMAGGGVDLSLGSVLALAGVCAALAVQAGAPLAAGAAAALAVGAAAGALNGALATVLRIPSAVVTLAALVLYRWAAAQALEGQAVDGVPEALLRLARAAPGGVPAVVWLAVAAVGAGELVLRRHAAGRRLYARGAHRRLAEDLELRPGRLGVGAFAACGALVGLAGLLWVAEYNRAGPGLGRGFGLQALAVALLGGASVVGGRGSALGAALAAVFVGLVYNGTAALDVRDGRQLAVLGVLAAAVVLSDLAIALVYRRRRVAST